MNERDLMQALEGRAAAVDPAGPPTSAMIGRAATVRKRRTALGAVAAVAAVAVVATTLSLVGLGDDRADDLDIVSPGGTSGTLADALAVVPAETASFTFDDSKAAARRLGITASTAAEYADAIEQYAVSGAEAGDPGGLFGPMSVYVGRMTDLPVNPFEVQWSADGSLEPPSAIGLTRFTVYQVTPDTDLDAFADDLVAAGLVEENLRGRRHLVAENAAAVVSGAGLIGDGYPSDLLDVTIDTDADLFIVGSLSEAVLEVLDGERPSAAEAGTYDTILTGIDDVERAELSAGAPCYGEPAGVEEPLQTAELVHGADVLLTARLLFVDEATARSDVEGREAFFEAGAIGDGEAPLDSYGTYELTQEGSVVDIELDDMSSETFRSLGRVPGSIVGC